MMALLIDWKIGLIFLISTPLIVAVLYVIMSRSVPYYTRIQKGQDRISRLAGENLEGVRVIRAFSRQESEVRTFDAAGDELARLTVYVGKISAALNPITVSYTHLDVYKRQEQTGTQQEESSGQSVQDTTFWDRVKNLFQ